LFLLSHVGRMEHDVGLIVTEQGIADFRGLSWGKEALSHGGQTPHVLEKAFSWHIS
jgi:succinyl-CoA:acetate CoA-transferase